MAARSERFIITLFLPAVSGSISSGTSVEKTRPSVVKQKYSLFLI